MPQSIVWENVVTKTATTFGVLARLKVVGGWLVSNKPSVSSNSSKLITFVPDALHKWTAPEITWELLVNSGVSYGTTVRARVADGWLVGHRIGTTISSRSLNYTEDKDAVWLQDPIVDPAPTPTPVPTPSAKWIGTNLAAVTDWSTEFPFKDMMRKSRPPHSATSTVWNDNRTIDIDSRGNVRSLLPGQIARILIFTGQRPVVDYVATWEGEGTIDFVQFTTISSPTTNSRVIRPTTSAANAWIDITSVNVNNPLRNLTLVRADQVNAIGLFNPDYVTDLRRYASIRFMDWQNTNTLRSQASLQADFVGLNELPITFTNGSVPLEVMIQLCNETNVDAWFCIPINADAVYIDRFLNLVRDRLNPGLKAHIELSNEVWNGIFPQHTYIPGDWNTRITEFALRSADLAARTKAILGARGISVLGAQVVGTWQINNSLEVIKNAGKVLPEVVATAPYFGHGIPDDVSTFTDGRMNSEIESILAHVREGKRICDLHGVKMDFYEGGQHILGSTGGANCSRDSRMQATYISYLQAIKSAAPGSLFCHFNYACGYTQHGAWGEKEYQYAPDSPKSLAIKECM